VLTLFFWPRIGNSGVSLRILMAIRIPQMATVFLSMLLVVSHGRSCSMYVMVD
jgi:hypothetical protein